MECSVCTEKFNKSNHARVTCPKCEYIVCTTCTSEYLLNGTTQYAHCMNCKLGWTREILLSCGLTKKFVTDTYKARREEILLEHEKSLMPATQPYAERRLMIQKLEREIQSLWHQHHTNILVYNNLIQNQNTDDALGHIKARYNLLKERGILKNEIEMKQTQIRYLNGNFVHVRPENRKFIRACPRNDCRGFLNHVWYCGLCEKASCAQCHEPKDDDHVCNPESIESAKMITRETRPCPKCASMIFKIEGCDQMWCTQCSTTFSWRTGQIEIGRIHNPHYFEYMRERGNLAREIGDIPCGGMPHPNELGERKDRPLAWMIVRLSEHITHVLLPQYPLVFDQNKAMETRIDYMVNKITEERFKSILHKREKAIQMNTDIVNVLNTYQVVSAEIMQRYVRAPHEDERAQILSEMIVLKNYINKCTEKIRNTYNCRVPSFTETFNIVKE